MSAITEILERRYNRRRVRWISGLFAGFLIFEFVVMRIAQHQETGTPFASHEDMVLSATPLLVIALVLVSMILAFTRHQRAGQILQVLGLLLGGSAAITMNPTSTPASGTFYVLALFLASRYGFLERHALLKSLALGLLFLASVIASAWLYLNQLLFALLGAVTFVFIYTAIWFFAAEVEIRGLTHRYAAINTAFNRNKKAIDLGRGVLGIVHAFSGRVVALERAVELLQNGERGAGMSKLLAVQQDVTRLLENLKQSVVHQGEHEPREHRLGDVLRGLVELTRVTGNGDGTKCAVSLEIHEDIELRAPPAQIHTLFETVLRNALEAGARKVTIAVGPGRTVSVVNDGPPIPFCQSCKRLDCMGCREFREGRTTKLGGSGIGMVVAREIMSSYGSLSLTSTPERTVVRFVFQ